MGEGLLQKNTAWMPMPGPLAVLEDINGVIYARWREK